ncbi:hypothetical protein [Altererythrobacter sp. GH1-8]|uniref:hypothetical protein n=1 Tax=Altererythrobacter sp. GH1-8 TaxID=3349333 RepID=UPI00374D2B6E
MQKLQKSVLLGLAGLALVAGSPALAQNASDDPYQAMVDVFANDTMRDRAFDAIMVSAFRGALDQDAELQMLEIECPGLTSGLERAVRPIMKQSHVNDYVIYRQDLYTLVANELTREEAGKAAAFFGSDLGERFFASVFANQSLDHMVAEALATDGEENISEDAMRKDTDRTAIRALMALEPVDRKEITRVFETEEWAKSFAILRPKMDALLADPKFQDFTPEEDAAIETASTEFAEAHFAACFADNQN